jgi:hypothetical protein
MIIVYQVCESELNREKLDVAGIERKYLWFERHGPAGG